ncbi:hypothetical protein [Treponema bryantii]|uniref:hypothetical protein n=1 Tax=Treponema bryantii TaxID=163 RepID=UPI0003B62A54|nr:hypothetical protein [Treponema bryantii]
MSGKMARRLRKKNPFSKKTLALCAGLCISSAPIAAGGEFLVSVFPQFTKPFGEAHSIEYGMGAGLKATYRPIKFLNLFAQGEYLSASLPGIAPITILDASLGTGYHIDVTDRISFDLNVNVGAYNARTEKSVAGISAGGSLVFSYKLTPSIYLDVNASGKHFAAKPSPLMMVNAGIGPGVTFNITEIFNNKTNLGVEVNELAPVFPVLYFWYENNPFGSVNITNNEDTAISDVTVSFFQPQYMAHAKECATFKSIKRDETVSVDLLAFFNEQMLELTEKTDTSSYIIVNYSRLGKKLSQSYALDVPVYGRNNMSWDDDRRAAVFVSSKDPAAMQFGKYVASFVRDNLLTDMPVNIQYAIGIFQTLNEFGLNYVVDPSSAFEDNVGTSSIDFLQFPYQTLMYRGGDCDDLSILVCSLFEAVGIETAFITVPGHIFMAFDSGLTPDQAKMIYRNSSEYVVIEDQVWIPLEITLSDEGFYRACRYGAREWNSADAQGTAALYRMRDSWKIYQPISVPGASAYFNLPERDAIIVAFNKGAEEWKHGELRNDPLRPDIQFVALEEEEEDEFLVIKGNPLSRKSLNDIVSIGNAVAALAPSQPHEEEDKKDEEFAAGGADGDGFGGDDDEEELLENIIPLDYAIATATLQTDVQIKQNENAVVDWSQDKEDSQVVEWSQSDRIETTEENFTDDLSFLEDYYERVTQPKTPAAAPADDNKFETTDEFLEELEAAASQKDNTVVEGEAAVVELPGSDNDNAVVEWSRSDRIETTTDDRHPGESRHPELGSGSRTKTIIIISSVTIAAALAAGIIIKGKKRREEESK